MGARLDGRPVRLSPSPMLKVAVLMQALASLPANAPVDAAGNRVDWVARPNAREAFKCFAGLPKDYDAKITLQCRTAPHDRVDQCVVVANTAAPDRRYEPMAICSAEKAFRVRAVDPSGKTIAGTSLNIPVHLRRPG